MSLSGSPAPLPEHAGPFGAEDFAAIRQAARPCVLRGIVADWPAVAAARRGDESIRNYLAAKGSARPVSAIAAPPEEGGRFFYTPDLSRLNFVRGQGRLEAFLDDLLRARDLADPPAMAVQSEDIASLLPQFVRDNALALLPGVAPRIWIGNRIRVAPHYDAKENVACCVSGRRRFTLFPPDQIANLYPGPFELTPAGTPVSMVDLASPDLEAHPRFAEAWAAAQQAMLKPGDAIYIPYGWWHGVESLDPVSILVNYWWTEGLPAEIGGAYDALLHAMLAYRHLPEEQRDVWRTLLDYYVFERSGVPAAHLPASAAGILGPPSPPLFARMREIIRQALG
ncbi:cupin-like domain-containing protein [Qipengyuania sp. 6B39]|uniref:cupin-like domain-containing protein n=1 Tax=Qipengyuania proteolytica TaxID=2867239 RepID=UPI001C8B0091|nr:cupin-like domain-containing protein [Qipengyuania proteolytica]MBX7495751.1 cupin-like domain-containing protein [Qipengyuania proteolytica]